MILAGYASISNVGLSICVSLSGRLDFHLQSFLTPFFCVLRVSHIHRRKASFFIRAYEFRIGHALIMTAVFTFARASTAADCGYLLPFSIWTVNPARVSVGGKFEIVHYASLQHFSYSLFCYCAVFRLFFYADVMPIAAFTSDCCRSASGGGI